MLDQLLIVKILEHAKDASPKCPMFPQQVIQDPQIGDDHFKACLNMGYLEVEEGEIVDGVPVRIIGITEKGAQELKEAQGG